MRRMLYVAFAALVLAIPATSSAKANATVTVKITPGAFAPASVTINAGSAPGFFYFPINGPDGDANDLIDQGPEWQVNRGHPPRLW